MTSINLRVLGQNCKKFRMYHGFYQTDVSNDTGYSKENISSFETGRNDNLRILIWYLEHGIKISELLEGAINE